MTIESDISNVSGVQCLQGDGTLMTDYSKMSWEMSGEMREVSNGPSQIITVPQNVPVQIGNEISTSREIALTEGVGTSVSGGINLLLLQASLQKSWDYASQRKFEQTNTRVVNYTLNWDVCDTWKVDYYKTIELGHVEVPGMDKKLGFDVMQSQRVVPTPLCEAGTNIATSTARNKEKDAVHSSPAL